VIRVILWGGTGQAKVLREALDSSTHRVVAVFDRNPEVESPFTDVPIFHGDDGFRSWLARDHDRASLIALVAIGGDRGADRLAIQARLRDAGVAIGRVVHPSAYVARDAVVGEGSQILALAAVATEARVGRACIVNTSASVDHECVLADGVHVAPGAHLAGAVEVGACAMIGIGAVVLPRVRIGDGAIVGAGAVVLKDVPAHATVVGNPARLLRDSRQR
jgi:sugar O-acyltransferase (sialic acid O-acetyltransferase NeuD family)